MIGFTKIHSDIRGSINCIIGDLGPYPEVTIFETKKGLARGGCIHSMSSEFICVLVGVIEFVYGEKQEVRVMKAGESFMIHANVPHYFIALEDSVVMEWGPQMVEKNQRHLEFRKIVDDINANKGV